MECCPPNLVRFLATMPGYIYAQDKRDAVYVNLYVTSRAAFKVARTDLSLAVESDMPWGGRSVVTVTSSEPTRASIKLRVPGWARNQPAPGSLYAYADALNKPSVVAVNGKTRASAPDRFGYITLDRVWRTGDSIDDRVPDGRAESRCGHAREGRPRPRGDRARTDRLLRGMARLRRRSTRSMFSSTRAPSSCLPRSRRWAAVLRCSTPSRAG